MCQKLNAEIDEAEKAGKLSEPSNYAEIAMLPYLYRIPLASISLRLFSTELTLISTSILRTAVINEALRIHPSTGTILERYVPTGGMVLHGKHIPAGTTIGVNAWVMNRNKEVFGEDVEDFRPERWIDSPPEKMQMMKKNLLTVSLLFALPFM